MQSLHDRGPGAPGARGALDSSEESIPRSEAPSRRERREHRVSQSRAAAPSEPPATLQPFTARQVTDITTPSIDSRVTPQRSSRVCASLDASSATEAA